MALYMNLMKLSSAGAKAVMEEGMAARVVNAEKTLGAVGAKVVGYWAIADGDYDLVAIMDFPEVMANAATVRTSMLLKQTGAFDSVRTFRLATADEVDSGATGMETAYRAPGAR